jgi:hypothetical protein
MEAGSMIRVKTTSLESNEGYSDIVTRLEAIVEALRNRGDRIVALTLIRIPVDEARAVSGVSTIWAAEIFHEYDDPTVALDCVGRAMNIATSYGQIEGDHHRAWVIDQMVRALLASGYDEFVKNYTKDGSYTWDVGIAP